MKKTNLIHITRKLKEEMMGKDINCMPIQAKLSLEPIVRYLQEQIDSNTNHFGPMFTYVLQQFEQTPELHGVIEDDKLLEKNAELVSILLSALVPYGLNQSLMAYVTSPFNLESFFMTDALRDKLEHGQLDFDLKEGECKNFNNIIIKACTYILDKVWGYDLHFDLPMIFVFRDSRLQTKEYYKSVIAKDFIEIVPLESETVQRPDELTVKRLLSNINNVDEWIKVIQPEKFEIRGVIRAQLIDVTEDESLSRIKYKLLEKDALVRTENIRELEQLVRDYFRKGDMTLGLSAIDFPRENQINHRYKIRHDILADSFPRILSESNSGSILEKTISDGAMQIFEDIEALPVKTPIELKYLEKGIRSVVINPLAINGKTIGFLELGMEKTYSFNSLDSLKIHDLEPLFSTALVRSREEIDNRIDAIIREQYTAIHPSVEWRFVQSAYDLMEQREKDPFGAKPESIVFKDVIPLYAQADISNSSATRNRAIQKDLIENLQMVEQILQQAQSRLDMPIIKHYAIKTKEVLQRILLSINSNDEVAVIDFLRDEIYPLFQMVKQADTTLGPTVTEYCDTLDPALGILYKERKAYEDSVAMINDTIASYLDMKEQQIQKTIPHYFEKYKTDGVEFDVYVGTSLMKNGEVTNMHVRNMRLWQLIILCEIGRLVDGISSRMPIPMETSQLALVHSNPLSIRFRMDEKRFDVDGAYNVRYEIIKKRIDKALVKGEKTQRLTTPNTVSIVYTQDKDKGEYEEYISFLVKNGYISEEVEHFELEKTQGVEGLKAFRLRIRIETDQHEMEGMDTMKEIREILASS